MGMEPEPTIGTWIKNMPPIYTEGMTTLRANAYTISATDTFFFIIKDLPAGGLRFRVLTPETVHIAALKKNNSSYTRAIVP